MLGRDPAALRLADLPALGDAEQRVVRLVHAGGGEEALVGGDQRQAERVGQRDQRRLDRLLDRQPMPVQLHHATRPGNASASRASRPRPPALRPSASSRRERPARAAGQQDQPVGVGQQRVERDCGRGRVGLQEAGGGQRAEVGEPRRVLRQQHDRVGRQAGLVGRARTAIWQPMIGCTPLPTQAWLNSSAPNRLPLSAIATAGMPVRRASAAILSGLIAPSLSE